MTLKVENLVRRFGGLAAVDGVSFDVEDGECLGIIGANGSGKTTTINLLTRVDDPTRGTMRLDGVDYTRRPSHHLPRLGIARTFQNLRLFHDLTVEENVTLAAARGGRCSQKAREGARQLLGDAGIEELVQDLAREPALRHSAGRRGDSGARHRPAGALPR